MKKVLISFLSGIAFIIPLVWAASITFPDVKRGDWFYKDVQKMVEWGVIRGNDDGTFAPSHNVNRAELSAMLNRYNEYLKTQFQPKEGVEIREALPFDIQKKMKCMPETKEVCLGSDCEAVENTVWLIYDPLKDEASRCDAAGCETFNVIQKQEDTILKIQNPTTQEWNFMIYPLEEGRFTEEAPHGEQMYRAEGHCENM